jgi:hypothetical protein
MKSGKGNEKKRKGEKRRKRGKRRREEEQRAKETATHLHPTQQVSQAPTPPPNHQALWADTSPTTP